MATVKHYDSVKAETVDSPAENVKIRWLIDEKLGAENFFMRLFDIAPGGNTPFHAHDWEHEIYVLEGKGFLVEEGKKTPLKPWDFAFIPANEKHQFINHGDVTFRFICLIPNKEK